MPRNGEKIEEKKSKNFDPLTPSPYPVDIGGGTRAGAGWKKVIAQLKQELQLQLSSE